MSLIVKIVFWGAVIWFAIRWIDSRRFSISPKVAFRESEMNLKKRQALGYDVSPDGRSWSEVREEQRVKEIRKSSGYGDDE